MILKELTLDRIEAGLRRQAIISLAAAFPEKFEKDRVENHRPFEFFTSKGLPVYIATISSDTVGVELRFALNEEEHPDEANQIYRDVERETEELKRQGWFVRKVKNHDRTLVTQVVRKYMFTFPHEAV